LNRYQKKVYRDDEICYDSADDYSDSFDDFFDDNEEEFIQSMTSDTNRYVSNINRQNSSNHSDSENESHTRGASPDKTTRTIKVSLNFIKSEILFLASRQSHARKSPTTPHSIKYNSRTTPTCNMVIMY
jgi:hypothetical protein